MAADYEEVCKIFREWDIEELKFGFWWVFSNLTEDNFDEDLLRAYLDVLDEKDPPPPPPDKYEAYGKFRKIVYERYGAELPPMERDSGTF